MLECAPLRLIWGGLRAVFNMTELTEKPNQKYRVIRDDHGYACAIAEGDQWILHLNPGTEFNEKNADRIVGELNDKNAPPMSYEELKNCCVEIRADERRDMLKELAPLLEPFICKYPIKDGEVHCKSFGKCLVNRLNAKSQKGACAGDVCFSMQELGKRVNQICLKSTLILKEPANGECLFTRATPPEVTAASARKLGAFNLTKKRLKRV